MYSWVRYSITVYVGLLLAGSVTVTWPTASAVPGHPSASAAEHVAPVAPCWPAAAAGDGPHDAGAPAITAASRHDEHRSPVVPSARDVR
jgi:hypothetical protein